MASLPMDLVSEILSRLPVKSLIRFKSVSKNWLHVLTSDSTFAELHFSRLTNSHNSVLMLVKRNPRDCYLIRSHAFRSPLIDETHGSTPLLLPFRTSGRQLSRTYLQIISSCNGILCLSEFLEYPEKIVPDSTFFLWNPSTNQHVTIPPTPHFEDRWCTTDLYTKYGFGFCSKTNAYKLVGISSYGYEGASSLVSVLTLGEDSWRLLGDIPYILTDVYSCNTLVNGALHWNGTRPGSEAWDLIVAFDIKDEMFREIPLPAAVALNYINANLVVVSELGGNLCFLWQSDHRILNVHIWVMKEYGVANTWTKQYMFQRPKSRFCDSVYLEPLDILDSGELLLTLGASYEVYLYNPTSGKVKELEHFALLYHKIYHHVRSLISPRTIVKKRKRTDAGDDSRQ